MSKPTVIQWKSVSSYHRAYEAEQRRGRRWFFAWVAITLLGAMIPIGAWRIAWFGVVVVWMLLLFQHYDRDAIRHRAFWASDPRRGE